LPAARLGRQRNTRRGKTLPFTNERFSRKLAALRTEFSEDIQTVARLCGLPVGRLENLERGVVTPTGDEILIIADHFKRDFRYLLDDDAEDTGHDLDVLFRQHGDALNSDDRHAVAEFTFLCSMQAFLEELLGRRPQAVEFRFRPVGKYYKRHGSECADALRNHLGLQPHAIVPDIFGCLRRIGLRVFRRGLVNTQISGIFLQHPGAGACVLINYAEGLPRQRFSAAHELAHALLDGGEISFSTTDDLVSQELTEIRANTFASEFLMPPALLHEVPADHWRNPDQIIEWARRLMVSVPALLTALRQANLITAQAREELRSLQLRYEPPSDPELPADLTTAQHQRKEALLRRGLSQEYVGLCIDAYTENAISRGKLAEALLLGPHELPEVAALYGRTLGHE